MDAYDFLKKCATLYSQNVDHTGGPTFNNMSTKELTTRVKKLIEQYQEDTFEPYIVPQELLYAAAPKEVKFPKVLIVGSAQHGKSLVAELLASYLSNDDITVTYKDVSTYARKLGLISDSMSREKKYELIKSYNRPDPARIVSEILQSHQIVVGVRDAGEFAAAVRQFDHIVYVEKQGVKHESNSSNTVVPIMAKDVTELKHWLQDHGFSGMLHKVPNPVGTDPNARLSLMMKVATLATKIKAGISDD